MEEKIEKAILWFFGIVIFSVLLIEGLVWLMPYVFKFLWYLFVTIFFTLPYEFFTWIFGGWGVVVQTIFYYSAIIAWTAPVVTAVIIILYK